MNIGQLKKIINDIPDDYIASGLESVVVYKSNEIGFDINDKTLSYTNKSNKVVFNVFSLTEFIVSNIDLFSSSTSNFDRIKDRITFDLSDKKIKKQYEELLDSTIRTIWKDRFMPHEYPTSKNSKVILLDQR